ncbi:MAG TPA: sensor histidine kinase, partial [Ginsengibacter sp.]
KCGFIIINMRKITCFLMLVMICNTSFCQSKISAQKGILDLRQWNWTKEGISDLNGEWEFYWKYLYTPSSFDSVETASTVYANVPGFWNSLIPGKRLLEPGFGYATYRLKVLCPPSNEKLALKLLTVSSAYKLYVNGKQILQIGNVGTSKPTARAAFKPVIVPVTPEKNELNIVIQVSNYDYGTGGLWDYIKLGPQEQIDAYWIRNVSRDYFISGSFFLMGIFYFVVYLFFRRRLSPLYFSIFCMLVSIRPLVTDELAITYVTNWSWQFIKHIEFVSLYLAVPILSLFSYELFPVEFPKKILRTIVIVSVPFVLITLFASPLVFRYSLRPFQVYMLLTACYGLVVYTKAVKKKRPGSVYFLIGFILFFITFINDLLYTSLIIESVHLVYIGLFVFVVSQGIALSRQFFWTFSRLEVVNEQLEQINDELSTKNNTINETNEKLTKLNSELDSLVYRTSHDLRSPVTSILTLVEIIKEEKDEAKRNEYLNMQTNTLFRLDSLITDTLDFAKNKRIELNYEPVDFREMIESALLDHIFSENSESIERVVEIHQQGIFITDKTRLDMVIRNLISNALKYHNKDQAHPYLKIVVSATDRHAQLQVEDNGQGIGEKHLDHIFTLFYRANKVTTGSGIGLYIVKDAIEKLGGTIKIESQINVGTKFMIDIPNYKGE